MDNNGMQLFTGTMLEEAQGILRAREDLYV